MFQKLVTNFQGMYVDKVFFNCLHCLKFNLYVPVLGLISTCYINDIFMLLDDLRPAFLL